MPAAVMPPDKKLMTADEFYEFCIRPENQNRDFDLVRGEVVEMSLPRMPYGIVCGNIAGVLYHYAESNSFGYVVTNDTGVILERDPDTVRGPDVAFFNDVERFEEVDEKWAESLPLVAVEVLSPNFKKREVADKRDEYLASGVPEVWIVDFEKRSVELHYPKSPTTVLSDKEVLHSKVLPGFSMDVAKIFRMPRTWAPKSE